MNAESTAILHDMISESKHKIRGVISDQNKLNMHPCVKMAEETLQHMPSVKNL